MKTKFTLIKLMIVIAIVGILAAITIPIFSRLQCRQRIVDAGFEIACEARKQLMEICGTESYRHDHNIFKKLHSGEITLRDIFPKKKISDIDEFNKAVGQETKSLERAVGTIRCYLSNGESYFFNNWIGEVKQEDNIFIFNDKYNEKEIKVSGPCIVREG